MTALDDSIAEAVGRIPVARRGTVDQLLLDLTTIWGNRYHHGAAVLRDPELFPVYAAGLLDAWTVLYLLGLLRTHAPDVAEQAAHFLNVGSMAVPGDHLPVFAHEWRRAVEEGRSLIGLLP